MNDADLPVRSVLLDIDGTLLDTRRYILAAFAHAASRHGLTLPSEAVMTGNIGRPLDRIYLELGARSSAISEIIETHRAFQEEHLDMVTAFQGANDALDALRANGLSLAAVTSRSRRTSTASLACAGIAHHFAVVISAEDASALKPDPAPLRAALAVLGQPPEAAVMVGDTVHDIEAGQALAMRTIGVRYGFGGAVMVAAQPTATISNLGQLPGAVAELGSG